MVTIASIRDIGKEEYDEIWAIVRSSKNIPSYVKHVPELAPSWDLFHEYLKLRDDGEWNEETFASIYAPRFLDEMKRKEAREKLDELVKKSGEGKRICLYCFCSDESLCHRSILAGILSEKTKVDGVARDYGEYGRAYEGGFDKKEPWALDVKHHSLCLTGPRPNKLCGYDRNRYKPFIKRFGAFLNWYYDIGIKEFRTGGAQGLDQLGFWTVHYLKRIHPDVKNVVYVPFQGQESIWPKNGCFSRSDYGKMLELADEVVCLREEKPNTKWGIVDALYERNERMSSGIDVVIALQNDDGWRINRGGTANCMKSAHARGVPIHRLTYETEPILTMKNFNVIESE